MTEDGGNLQVMRTFKVNVVARNPKREELTTQPVPALVDPGSELSWVRNDSLQLVGRLVFPISAMVVADEDRSLDGLEPSTERTRSWLCPHWRSISRFLAWRELRRVD